MAKVRTIPPAEATGSLAEIYRRIGGNVGNILRVQSLSPATLEAHYALYRAVMFGRGGLSRAQRELIAVAVSQRNDCHYWVEHHAASFRRVARDQALADAVAADVDSAPLADPDRALVRFAQALTSHPAVVPDREIDAMRPFFDDAAVLRATEVVAYFNFVNRLATGLAVELEEEAP